MILSPEEEHEFWSAVGANDVSREKLTTVLSRSDTEVLEVYCLTSLIYPLSRLQHEDRLSMSSLGQESSEDNFHCSPRPPVIQLTEISQLPPSLGPFLASLIEKVRFP